MSAVQVFWKHCVKRRDCLLPAISPFQTMFFIPLKKFQSFPSTLKLSSAKSFSLEESKICRLPNNKPIPKQWHLLTHLGKKPFVNIVRKGEIACTSNFSFSHNVFYSIKGRSYYFLLHSICPLQMISIWSGPNFVVWEWVNPLPNNKILDITKVKGFAVSKLHIAKMIVSLFDKSRKHCGNGRKCWLPAFSAFHTVFSKAFFLRVTKIRIAW